MEGGQDLNPECPEHVYLQRLEPGYSPKMGQLVWNVKCPIPGPTSYPGAGSPAWYCVSRHLALD